MRQLIFAAHTCLSVLTAPLVFAPSDPKNFPTRSLPRSIIKASQ